MQENGVLIIKLNKNKQKQPRRGKKLEDRQRTVLQFNITHTKDNGSAQDCRHQEANIGRQTRVTRETRVEPLKQ